jgi:hypothetical protein
MAEYKIVVTRNIPGVDEAAKILPPQWQLWVNPSEQPLTRVRIQAPQPDILPCIIFRLPR